MRLEQLLKLMTEKGASDLHIKPMRPPLLRIHGRLMPLEAERLTPEQIKKMIMEILSPQQKARLQEKMVIDLGVGVSGTARFRGNIYHQRGTLAAAFRRIPFNIKTLAELELPSVLNEFADLPKGLVLITGPTGSGKSTTLATMIDRIASTRPAHVLTVEDPIEFLFSDRLASISQREVGTDTLNFTDSLRSAMRQDPDIIMVGEMRDLETVSTVLTAAETGHLVFSTLHTNSATQTIDRILDIFPINQQKQVRVQLAQVFKGIASMQLVNRADGTGRVAALEVMRATPQICNLIEKGETGQLLEEVESSVAFHRMQSMNQSLISLLVHGTITYEEAITNSWDPDDLSLKLRGMFPSIEEDGGEMAPTTSDFSQILELEQYRKLYEEQEEKTKISLGERDDRIAELEHELTANENRLEEIRGKLEENEGEADKIRTEYDRFKSESQAKIDKLSERVRELNRRLMNQ
jgi:twitching motility protein PilT